MIKFCITHNGICYNDTNWHFPEENVEQILHYKRKPAMMAKCPKCSDTAKRIEDFLKRNYGRK